MALGQIDLYNGALLLCKEEALANLSENREPRYKLDQIWNEGAGNGSSIINACLMEGSWIFAKRTVQLDYNQSITPNFGYNYACNKPTDYKRMMRLSADEFFNEELNDFEEQPLYFLSNYQTLWMQYVSNDPQYGGNLNAWPEPFTEYVKAYMAYKIVGRLTGSKVDPQEILKERNRCLADAQGKDAMERPAARMPISTWVKARRGSRGMLAPYPPKP